MDCQSCGGPVPASASRCPVCQADVGFPNVRAARADRETNALRQRVADALTSARARGCEAILAELASAVGSSMALIARSLSVVLRLVSSDTELYPSYYLQVAAGTRIPEENYWDRRRGAVDQALFPNYAERITFAALSLDGLGLARYGAYAIVLREDRIEHRATVFEENPFAFFQRHRVVTGDPVPPGYRALWASRGQLAQAKLQYKLDPTTQSTEFAQILLTNGPTAKDDDFIEVHVFGPIHRRAIERVIGPKPKKKDRALVRSLENKLHEVGARLELR